MTGDTHSSSFHGRECQSAIRLGVSCYLAVDSPVPNLCPNISRSSCPLELFSPCLVPDIVANICIHDISVSSGNRFFFGCADVQSNVPT